MLRNFKIAGGLALEWLGLSGLFSFIFREATLKLVFDSVFDSIENRIATYTNTSKTVVADMIGELVLPIIVAGLIVWLTYVYVRRQMTLLQPVVVPLTTETVSQPQDIIPELPVSEPQERIFVPPELTLERLASFYEDNTAMQAAEITKRYIGQWMNVSITIASISPFNGSFSQVTRERPPLFERKSSFDQWFVYLHFKEPWVNRLSSLKHGDKITAACQIRTIEPVSVNFYNCEIVDDIVPYM